MKNRILIIALLAFSAIQIMAQDIQIFDDFESLEKHLTSQQEDILVVNFWATWCKPCVKELPYFNEIPDELDGKSVKVVLVSLDFKRQIERKLVPFLESNPQKHEVVLMGDSNYNNWINKVSSDWQGSIPATWVFKDRGRTFVESEFHSTEEIVTFIKK